MKLKNINFGLGLVALLALSSCADDKFSEYRTDMTKNLKEYQYLNNYEPLKKYVEDMKASGKCNPDFKLGIALAAADFNKQELVYCLAGSNFEEMTAGNAMKYASCVRDDGTFDFSTVKDFVTNAQDAGLTIYGHTLAWHSQQNKKYLSKLIADKEIQVDPSQKVEKTDYQLDCSTLTKYDWSGSPESVKTEWNKDGAVVITNPEPIEPFYKLQYWLVNGISLDEGKDYKLTIECKAEGASDANIHFKLGNWGGGDEQQFTIPVGKGYQKVVLSVSPKMANNGIMFQHGDFAGKIYWKSITISHMETPVMEIPSTVAKLDFEGEESLGGWGMDHTPENVNGVCQVGNDAAKNAEWNAHEEKKTLLTDAMGKWIDGMMETTDGYVTSWDVVNEAISGKKGADGFNELQHATNAPASDVANSFYWQDYLGDIDYVRTAVRDARKSFAEHNGDPSKLKLFINDYNLEGYWDKHAKLKSLIHWIGLWEDPNAEEPVVIDGIGTQMHVTCYGDATKQAKLQSDIEEMFKLMAKTGKLVKISELDMAYEDEAGTSVTFDKMTEEQHKQMRSFYTFIIQKYFELIPLAQQYGITQWCATDSPKDSGWRAGCPTGLWDSNYLRKHTYAGFAVGLGAPEYWNDAK